MLVLEREIGETIVIGDNIRIMFVGFHGSRAKIGIDTPRHVQVVRSELLQSQRENQGLKGGLSR